MLTHIIDISDPECPFLIKDTDLAAYNLSVDGFAMDSEQLQNQINILERSGKNQHRAAQRTFNRAETYGQFSSGPLERAAVNLQTIAKISLSNKMAEQNVQIIYWSTDDQFIQNEFRRTNGFRQLIPSLALESEVFKTLSVTHIEGDLTYNKLCDAPYVQFAPQMDNMTHLCRPAQVKTMHSGKCKMADKRWEGLNTDAVTTTPFGLLAIVDKDPIFTFRDMLITLPGDLSFWSDLSELVRTRIATKTTTTTRPRDSKPFNLNKAAPFRTRIVSNVGRRQLKIKQIQNLERPSPPWQLQTYSKNLYVQGETQKQEFYDLFRTSANSGAYGKHHPELNVPEIPAFAQLSVDITLILPQYRVTQLSDTKQHILHNAKGSAYFPLLSLFRMPSSSRIPNPMNLMKMMACSVLNNGKLPDGQPIPMFDDNIKQLYPTIGFDKVFHAMEKMRNVDSVDELHFFQFYPYLQLTRTYSGLIDHGVHYPILPAASLYAHKRAFIGMENSAIQASPVGQFNGTLYMSVILELQ